MKKILSREANEMEIAFSKFFINRNIFNLKKELLIIEYNNEFLPDICEYIFKTSKIENNLDNKHTLEVAAHNEHTYKHGEPILVYFSWEDDNNFLSEAQFLSKRDLIKKIGMLKTDAEMTIVDLISTIM